MNTDVCAALPNYIVPVTPVVDYGVRALCYKPYPLHPKGCPNAGTCDRCPPAAGLIEDAFDLEKPVFAVVNEFDIACHMAVMAARHSHWSERQLRNVLYWQPKARKALGEKIKEACALLPGFQATTCPEAMGVDVTATLAVVGIDLEWPPQRLARQVALIAWPR